MTLDIENGVVAFVAWDDNKLPMKIKGRINFTEGAYVKLVNYNDINLVPGKTYGHDSGFELEENHIIKTFKAIVVSYKSFNGVIWDNLLFEDWKSVYEGNRMN
ncbi:MAG: DUF5780 domain-containing protein [Clostridiales bacterium]|nr:DUF5780 domain-containing protein [Clostridiales bacterium]